MDLTEIVVRAGLILAVWIVLSLPLAVLVGRMIAFGDRDVSYQGLQVPAPQSNATSRRRAA
jgi:hypothetical protein